MILWNSFDKNEIFLLIFNVIAYMIVLLMPKKFTRTAGLLFFFWGVTIGMLYDFTIGGGLLDYYKSNDSNQYEIFDVVYCFLYGAFGYIFFYFYEKLNINKKTFIFYTLAWAITGVAFQFIFMKLDIITLQNGYKLPYSFVVFLITQTISGVYYEILRGKERVLLKGR
jgi:hypothetical protein